MIMPDGTRCDIIENPFKLILGVANKNLALNSILGAAFGGQWNTCAYTSSSLRIAP